MRCSSVNDKAWGYIASYTIITNYSSNYQYQQITILVLSLLLILAAYILQPLHCMIDHLVALTP